MIAFGYRVSNKMRDGFWLVQQDQTDVTTLHFVLDRVFAAVKFRLGENGCLDHDVILERKLGVAPIR